MKNRKNKNKGRKNNRKKRIDNRTRNKKTVISSQVLQQRDFLPDSNLNTIKHNNLTPRNNNFHVSDYQLEGAKNNNTNRHLYIGNVAKGTEKSIVNHIWSKGFDCIAINKVSRESSSFKSFKLTVANSYYPLLLKSDFWPINVVVKPWIDFKSRESYRKKEHFNSNLKYSNVRK